MSPNSTLREKLSYFYRVSHIFSLTLDVDEVLRRVMDEAVAATGAERGFLLLRASPCHHKPPSSSGQPARQNVIVSNGD
jgi:GAF domain-containing protein